MTQRTARRRSFDASFGLLVLSSDLNLHRSVNFERLANMAQPKKRGGRSACRIGVVSSGKRLDSAG